MQAESAFEHFDRIKAAKPGTWLIVCEPFDAALWGGGGHSMAIGTKIRVAEQCSQSLLALADVDGKVKRVWIDADNFSNLD